MTVYSTYKSYANEEAYPTNDEVILSKAIDQYLMVE
jgi:hypothetical protein